MLAPLQSNSISSVPSGTLPPCPHCGMVSPLSGELPVLDWPHTIHHSNRIIVAEHNELVTSPALEGWKGWMGS